MSSGKMKSSQIGRVQSQLTLEDIVRVAIGIPGLPTTTREVIHPELEMVVDVGGQSRFNANARRDSWQHVLRFAGAE